MSLMQMMQKKSQFVKKLDFRPKRKMTLTLAFI